VKAQLPWLAVLALVLIAPIALRQDRAPSRDGATLIIITPHNEAIRYEFGRAFAAAHHQRTGESVQIDWRTPGGTSEITRYIAGEYIAAFQQYWTHQLRKPWSGEVERAFANARIKLAATSANDTIEQQARRAFLESNVSCRLDLFFGGGAFDFQSQAGAGYLVDSGMVKNHPELFNDAVIPQSVSGEPFWDPADRWIGTVVSSFGICYNHAALRRLGIDHPPLAWSDLADPRYFRQIALANPTQSSSVNKSFEMVVQQQMQAAVEEEAPAGRQSATSANPGALPPGVARGWTRGLQLLMKIGANARYFTDASTKISLDVSTGEAAAGMTIDFYGRFQSENARRADGSHIMEYTNVAGGSSVGVDPIGIFRGAPHPELAREFIEFVFSSAGQKLWNWKPGAPDGPAHYALRRLPILPSLYAPAWQPFRSDPEVNPYELAKTFTYHESWSGPLFRSLAFIFRVMCIDAHDELSAAWKTLIAAEFPPEATAVFSNVDVVDYAAASGRIRDALGPNKIREVELARELSDHFRAQYRRAARLAAARR
jgi:ABC-type Fe3+ transport system substrate-binding protein